MITNLLLIDTGIFFNKIVNRTRIYTNLAATLAVVALLAACATDDQSKKPDAMVAKPVIVEPIKPPQSPPESPEKIAERAARAAAQAELDDIVALYNNGDYHGEVKRFTGSYENLKPYRDLELQALKYTAFSYCLIGRTTPCRQHFEKAVKLDPTFDLLPGEKGHPLWGPVFDRVKKKEGIKG